MKNEATVKTRDGRTIVGKVSEELWAGRRWIVVKPRTSIRVPVRLDPGQVLEISGPMANRDEKIPVAVAVVLDHVSDAFGVSRENLVSPQRGQQNICLARMVAMYVLREVHKYTFDRIGDILGGRDHGTIVHGHRRIEELIHVGDKEVTKKVRDVLEAVRFDLAHVGVELGDGQRSSAVL